MSPAIPIIDLWRPTNVDLRSLPQLYRLQAARHTALNAGGCRNSNGRIHITRSDVWVIYASLTILGCINEVVGNYVIEHTELYTKLRKQGLSRTETVQQITDDFSESSLPAALWALGGVGARLHLLDLTDPAVLARVGISMEDLTVRFDSQTGDSDDRIPVEIARQAYDLGWAGVIIPSIVPGEVNVNLFLQGRYADGAPRPREWPGTRKVSNVSTIDPSQIGTDFRRDFEAAVRRALTF